MVAEVRVTPAAAMSRDQAQSTGPLQITNGIPGATAGKGTGERHMESDMSSIVMQGYFYGSSVYAPLDGLFPLLLQSVGAWVNHGTTGQVFPIEIWTSTGCKVTVAENRELMLMGETNVVHDVCRVLGALVGTHCPGLECGGFTLMGMAIAPGAGSPLVFQEGGWPAIPGASPRPPGQPGEF
jgi:hypothetical protein